PDPCTRLDGKWVVRRLAPDCCRIDLGSLPEKRNESKLLRAMGLGDGEHSPRQPTDSESNPRGFAQAQWEVVARGSPRDGADNRRRLEGVEKEAMRLKRRLSPPMGWI